MTDVDTSQTVERRKPWPRPLRVWWIPQVPGTPFHVEVETPREALLFMDALAQYDLFQLEQNIKPDFSNAGGIEELIDGEWLEIDQDVFEEEGVYP